MALVNLRVTEDERAELHAKAEAAGMNLSDYLRSLAGLKLGRRGVTRTINKTSTPVASNPKPSDAVAEEQEEPSGESGVSAADLERRVKQLHARGYTFPVARAMAQAETRP